MSNAAWAGIITILLILLIFATRPALLRLAERIHERRHRHG